MGWSKDNTSFWFEVCYVLWLSHLKGNDRAVGGNWYCFICTLSMLCSKTLHWSSCSDQFHCLPILKCEQEISEWEIFWHLLCTARACRCQERSEKNIQAARNALGIYQTISNNAKIQNGSKPFQITAAQMPTATNWMLPE